MERRTNYLLTQVRELGSRLDEIEYHVDDPDPEASDDGELLDYIASLNEISWDLGMLRHHVGREIHAPFAVPESYDPVFALLSSVSDRVAELAITLLHRMEEE